MAVGRRSRIQQVTLQQVLVQCNARDELACASLSDRVAVLELGFISWCKRGSVVPATNRFNDLVCRL